MRQSFNTILLFQNIMDARSVLPDSIRDRKDNTAFYEFIKPQRAVWRGYVLFLIYEKDPMSTANEPLSV